MTIISAIQTYLLTYTGLQSGAPVWVDYLGSDPVEYSVAPLPGARIVEEYINGSSLRQYFFAFRATQSVADDTVRAGNVAFFEAFADWLDTQTEAGTLPSMDAGQTALSIAVTGWGYLFQEGESNTGIYQVQCRLEYSQQS